VPDVVAHPLQVDPALGREIVDLHIWAVRQGLAGAAIDVLFDGFCRRLTEIGVPLWWCFVGMPTLHPQWGGTSYIWRREADAIQQLQFARESKPEPDWMDGRIRHLLAQSRQPNAGGIASMRRRLAGPEAQLDFPALAQLAADGGTDYCAHLFHFGADGDASRGSGVAFSFATDAPAGFRDHDLALIRGVLPGISLAVMSAAGYSIAANLLAAYLGADAGRRVHAGAVERGSVEAIRAVLWYADIRGFTAIADSVPGRAVIALLDDTFETLTAALRTRGGQVLKFVGDGMLAIFPLSEPGEQETCRRALDAAAQAMAALADLNDARRAAGAPCTAVDLALHLGEVLYGNVGAVDRLDFTVIGPAVNEVARIEALCQPLDRSVLVSAAVAAAANEPHRLEPLGRHALRGVREPREIYALLIS
jgi:adenylate cyclase